MTNANADTNSENNYYIREKETIMQECLNLSGFRAFLLFPRRRNGFAPAVPFGMLLVEVRDTGAFDRTQLGREAVSDSGFNGLDRALVVAVLIPDGDQMGVEADGHG